MGILIRGGYRLRQFLHALIARISPSELALVAQQLTAGELVLFQRMPRYDQRHCLDVYYTLMRGDYHDPLLLRAALIHDCGKVDDNGRTIPLLYYGAFVLLKQCVPEWYARAAHIGAGALRPFAVHARHEVRSAQLARAAGSPPELVAILRDYAERRGTVQAQALRWADEQN